MRKKTRYFNKGFGGLGAGSGGGGAPAGAEEMIETFSDTTDTLPVQGNQSQANDESWGEVIL